VAPLLIACCSAADDTVAPVVSHSLDDQMDVLSVNTGGQTGVGCDVHTHLCRDANGTLSTGNGFVSMYSRTCEAGAVDSSSCSLPDAHAWDHRDGNLDVSQSIRMVNNDVTAVPIDQQNKTAVDYNVRSEWVVEYDAMDDAGNRAERLVFTLILDDTVKPTLTPTLNSEVTVESCDPDNSRQNPDDRQYWTIPKTNYAKDNMDGILSDEIQVSTADPSGRTVETKSQGEITDLLQIDSFKLGTWTVTYKVKDHAGMFGFHGQDNEATKSTTVTVQDTQPPNLYCNKGSCALASDSLVQPSLWSEHLISSNSGVGSSDECCTKCSDQAWQRKVGSTNQDPACGFFSYSATGTCHLFATTLTTLSNNVQQETGTVSGYPIDCRVRNSHECGTEFTDAGARCIDMRDSFKNVNAILADAAGTVQNKVVGDHIIEYNCVDGSGNQATPLKRYVEVSDTLLPELKITHNGGKVDDLHVIQHSAGYTADSEIVDELTEAQKGFACFDQCDGDITDTVDVQWTHDGEDAEKFDTLQVGTWEISYTCKDQQNNGVTKTRTINNEDKTKPILNPIGSDILTIQANSDLVYNDLGATCSDQVDGVIDHKVATSGDIVNTDKPGTYHVNYYCADSAENDADQATRTIIVEDTKCPSCTMHGKTDMMLEAAFDFTDPGASCSDSLDGSLETQVSGAVTEQEPGTYFITYSATDAAGNANYGPDCTLKEPLVRTVIVEDTLKPVISLTMKDGSILQSGSAGGLGHNDVPNHAAKADEDGGSNPYLMAESPANVNGWIIAGVGAAVTGVALMGLSSSKSESLPVPV